MDVRAVALVGVMAMSACAFQSGSKVAEPQRGSFGARSSIPLPGQRDVRGKLQAVDGGKVVVRTRQGPVTLHTDDGTTVFSEGQMGALSDLRPGEEIRASVASDGGRDMALWIETPRPKQERSPGTEEGKKEP